MNKIDQILEELKKLSQNNKFQLKFKQQISTTNQLFLSTLTMICKGKLCFQPEKPYGSLELNLRVLNSQITDQSPTKSVNKDDQDFCYHDKIYCYSTKTSLKSFTKQTDVANCKINVKITTKLEKSLSFVKKGHKVSISELKKTHNRKIEKKISSRSSVMELSVISDENSIIQKLQNMDAKIGKSYTRKKQNNFESPEIYLPEPKEFVFKHERNNRLKIKPIAKITTY